MDPKQKANNIEKKNMELIGVNQCHWINRSA